MITFLLPSLQYHYGSAYVDTLQTSMLLSGTSLALQHLRTGRWQKLGLAPFALCAAAAVKTSAVFFAGPLVALSAARSIYKKKWSVFFMILFASTILLHEYGTAWLLFGNPFYPHTVAPLELEGQEDLRALLDGSSLPDSVCVVFATVRRYAFSAASLLMVENVIWLGAYREQEWQAIAGGAVILNLAAITYVLVCRLRSNESLSLEARRVSETRSTFVLLFVR